MFNSFEYNAAWNVGVLGTSQETIFRFTSKSNFVNEVGWMERERERSREMKNRKVYYGAENVMTVFSSP